MKGLVHKTICNQRGAVFVWFLIFLPLLLTAMMFSMDYTQATTSSDVDMQKGLDLAVKAAAMSVIPASQASGKPRIDPNAAITAFKTVLAKNLGLDPGTMAPKPGSMLKATPDYVLVVYDGDMLYTSDTGYKYTFTGNVLTPASLSTPGFPYTFGVSDLNITPGGGGVYNVTLTEPGCVAVLKENVVKVLGKQELKPIRYSSARIVCGSGACH